MTTLCFSYLSLGVCNQWEMVSVFTLRLWPWRNTLLHIIVCASFKRVDRLLSLLHLLKRNFIPVCPFKVAFCCSCFRLTRLFVDAQTVLSYSGNRSFSGFQDLMESVQRLGERPGAWPSTTFKSSYSTHLKTVWHSDTETTFCLHLQAFIDK